MMRIGMLLLAAGAAAQEPVARLLPELNATMKARAAAVQAKRLDAASSTSTIEQCFVNVCSSDAVRSDLVSYCKAGGYDSCDSLSFHNAYYNAGTYAIRSEFAYDLDNLRLEDLPADQTTVSVGFELEALLVTGSCIDPGASRREQHPQGLQLQLGTLPRPTDTVVMQNLGYFQLKAPAPGVWPLSLAAGRSSELYSVLFSSEKKTVTGEGSLSLIHITEPTTLRRNS